MNHTSSRGRILILIIALLVPLLAVGAFTATLAKPAENMDNVVAAVVNNDDPVELQGQMVPLGRQLAAALVEGQGLETTDAPAANYSWVMTNASLAKEGLESGQYNAVVTIPPEFSAAATSTADADDEPTRALIDVLMSPRARLADETITHTIVHAAASSLGQELTGTYLENIFLGFNTLGEELGGAADGARALADGARALAGGAEELAGGTDQLAGGMGELAAGTGELSSGAGALASGARELSGGTEQLAGGARDLAGGLGELSGGMGEIAAGTGELAGGVSDLRSGTSALSTGAGALADGASELATGSREYAGGVAEFSAGLGELTGGAHELAGGLGELNDAVAVVPEYLDQIEAGLETGAHDVREFASQLAGSAGMIDQIITEVCAADPGGEACRILQQSVGGSEDLDAFLAFAAGGLNDLADYMEEATSDGGGLGQIQQLFTGIDELAGGAGELAGGLDALHAGSIDLADGAEELADGNDEIAEGVGALAGGAAELDGGVGDLQAGVNDLRSGADQLAGATTQAAGGAGELAGGAHELAGGTRDLAEGAGGLAGGVEELAAGAGELAEGADEVAQGTTALAEGTEELSSGSEELADGLGQATDEIPTYPDGKRETLAEVLADPMAVDDGGGMSLRWLAFFAVVALWAGGLWLLSPYPAVAPNASTSTRSPAGLTLRSVRTPLVIAAAQGLGVGAIVGIFADVSAGMGIGFTVFAMFVSIVFTMVQRGLVAWGGLFGVALTVLIAVFAVATALISAMPAAATSVVSWLPVGPAIFATQALESSISGVAGPVLGLLAWGAAGAVAVLLATRREQTRVGRVI